MRPLIYTVWQWRLWLGAICHLNHDQSFTQFSFFFDNILSTGIPFPIEHTFEMESDSFNIHDFDWHKIIWIVDIKRARVSAGSVIDLDKRSYFYYGILRSFVKVGFFLLSKIYGYL